MLIPHGQTHWGEKLLSILVAPRHQSLKEAFKKSIQTWYRSNAGLINLLMVPAHVCIPLLLGKEVQLASTMKMEFVVQVMIFTENIV